MEKVHAVWEFYDGPRTGIADYRRQPHYFSCQWDPTLDDYSETYTLIPINAETFTLALEQARLWQEWELAFHSGQVSADSHPGHGGRNLRYDELQLLLRSRISALASPSVQAVADFQPVQGSEALPRGVMRPLLVKWSAAT